MIRFLLRRLLHAGILIFVVLTASFFIIKLSPGDPLTRYYSPAIDPAAMDLVRRQLGLEDALPVQYLKTMRSFLVGNFGMSTSEYRPVSAILAEAIPRTLILTGTALLIQVLLGVALGMLSAARRHGILDRALSLFFLVLYSIPSFYLAFILVAFFSLKLGYLPSASMSSLNVGDGTWDVVRDRAAHMVLPVAVLALGSAAALARFTRGSLLDVIRKDYVQTARAKGVAEGKIMRRHVFKNALPEILTVVGLSVPILLGGAVVVEKVFAWPGMGSLVVDSIFARDYPVILAVNFVGACMVVLGNLLADVSYYFVDPRIKMPTGSEPVSG